MTELGAAVQERLSTLMNEVAPARDMQLRRDAWTTYQKSRHNWVNGLLEQWQNAEASLPPPPESVAGPKTISLELVATDTMDDKILASRMALAVQEKLGSAFSDLTLRMRELEGRDLDPRDVLHAEALLLQVVEQWTGSGMGRDDWPNVADIAQRIWIERLKVAYDEANKLLIGHGVLPTIDFAARVRRAAPARRSAAPAVGADSANPADEAGTGGSLHGGSIPGHGGGANGGAPESGPGGAPSDGTQRGRGLFGGRLGGGRQGSTREAPLAGGSARPEHGASGHSTGGFDPSGSGHRGHSEYGGALDETRLMTSATPLSRARTRALGVVGQIKRLLLGAGSSAADFESTAQMRQPSPRLAAAMSAAMDPMAGDGFEATVLQDYTPAGVARMAADLRRRSTDLKEKAETQNEKAIIEIVALMFQAILQEERIPPSIRVWFARLQMPVLHVALGEPDFFSTLDHPARQLIDRMGSCVMGFDASGIQGSALELEIKRIVQVIEQYPETGKRVFQLVYEEFQKFLAQFLVGAATTQKVVSVAQQVEQKETLAIQYTIELRNTLKDVPIRDEIRDFLFKVWAEVLAVSAIRRGPQHADTLALKKVATHLVWAASAKPDRAERARVIKELPQLLQTLRGGMTELGLGTPQQDAHIKSISDVMTDAFLSRTQTISEDQIAAMARRLENLEDYVSGDESVDELTLDAHNIEMMLGIDASAIDVVADGGSKPTPAMLSWAQELALGAWFMLDHNGTLAKVQFVWRSERKHLNLFAASDGHSYLIQARRLAAYLQAGLLLPQEEENLTVRATRDALDKLKANPERLLET